MFNRIVAVLLVITLTACSTAPRDTARESPVATHAGSPVTVPAGDAENTSENNDAARGADARQDRGAVKLAVAVFLIVLATVMIAAASRGLSRDIARSCCRP